MTAAECRLDFRLLVQPPAEDAVAQDCVQRSVIEMTRNANERVANVMLGSPAALGWVRIQGRILLMREQPPIPPGVPGAADEKNPGEVLAVGEIGQDYGLEQPPVFRWKRKTGEQPAQALVTR